MKTLLLMISTVFFLMLAIEVQAKEIISVKLRNYIGDLSKLSFNIKGVYSTLDPALVLNEGDEYTLSFKDGKMFLICGKSKMEIGSPFILYPDTYDEEHLIYIDGRPYMGAVEFDIEGKHIRPVNQILLEDYLKGVVPFEVFPEWNIEALKGVVPFEVFPEWNIEALKAQTLAARTYTITHKTPELDDTIQYQVYGGYNEFNNTKKAVIDTKGEIITFQNKPISAFYSASNGGITENNKNVWGGKPNAYFPIKPDPYDPIKPWNFTLQKTQIDLDEIQSKDWNELKEKDSKISDSIKKWLNRSGYDGDMKILSIPYFKVDNIKNESQRSMKGSIQIDFMRRLIDGTILFERVSLDHVELKKIRPMIGGGHFRSYLISSFEINPTSYKVSGKGHGHGVGMSQWGANEMAEEGKTYKEIIGHYYPGTQVKVDQTFQE